MGIRITSKALIEADPKHSMGTATRILRILNKNGIFTYEQIKNKSDLDLLRYYQFGEGCLKVIRAYQEMISNKRNDEERYEETDINTCLAISNIFGTFHRQISRKSIKDNDRSGHYEMIFRDQLDNELFRCYDLPSEEDKNQVMFISSNEEFLKDIEFEDMIQPDPGCEIIEVFEAKIRLSAKDLCQKLLSWLMKEYYFC